MNSGRVKNIIRNKGKQKEKIKEILLVENYGLEGDIHFGSKDRQVTMLSDESRKQLESSKLHGFCTMKFQENITTSGIELSQCSIGTEINLGESTVQILSIGKKCFEDCPRVITKEDCVLKNNCMFVKVIKSGMVRVGDVIKIKRN